jgi:hypothetical protein
MDVRKKKERKDDKSQPGDGEEHEGRKGESEALFVCVDIKEFSAMRPLFTLSIVSGLTYHVYCFLFRIRADSGGAISGEWRALSASKGEPRRVG